MLIKEERFYGWSMMVSSTLILELWLMVFARVICRHNRTCSPKYIPSQAFHWNCFPFALLQAHCPRWPGSRVSSKKRVARAHPRDQGTCWHKGPQLSQLRRVRDWAAAPQPPSSWRINAYNVVLVSAVQRTQWAIYIYPPPPWTSPPLQPIPLVHQGALELSPLCHTVSHKLSIYTWQCMYVNPCSLNSSEKQILYTNTCVWNLERWYRWACVQGRNRDAAVESRLVHTEGRGAAFNTCSFSSVR